MYRFLECKPVVVASEILNSKARGWVATLMDERFPEEREAVGFLQIALANSMDQSTKGAIKKIEKLLIVTGTSHTQVFITLFEPHPIHLVKRLLEATIKRFGDHVLKRALQSLHMMNCKDEEDVKAWFMAGEFEEEETCTNTPSRKEDLHLLQGAVVKYSGAQGCARVESQLSTFTNSIGDLENRLTALSEERDCHSLAQRIKECEDPKEKEWLEAEFAAESDILDQMHSARMALSDVKMRQEDMKDRMNRCISVVVDFKPGAVLYKVDFMSESQREELIKDNLDLRVQHYAKAYLGIYDDPAKQVQANELKAKIEDEVIKTHYALVQKGLLPDFEKDSRLKGGFIARTMTVTKHLLDGQASDKKAYKSKVDELQTRSDLKCTACKKKCAPRHYRVLATGICYPIASLASEPAERESIIVFCSIRCQQKWDETLMCPKCKTFDWEYDVKGKAPYPDPFHLLDNLAQYNYCRRYLENIPVCPITRKEPRMICLPLCNSCSSTMMPRTPGAPHLTLAFSYDDMPRRVF